jgi:PmbA protein
MVNPISIIERGLRKAESLGVSEAEVYVVKESSVTVKGASKGVESVEGGEVVNAFVRVLIGKRLAVQGGMISKPEDIDTVVESAAKIAKISPEDPQWVSLPKKLGSTPVYDISDPKLEALEPEPIMELVKRASELAPETDRRAYVTRCGGVASKYVKAVGNTYQSPQMFSGTMFEFVVEVKAVDGAYESGFYDFYYAPTMKEFSLEKLVTRAVRVAVDTLKASMVPTGVYQVLLTPKVFSAVLEALIAPAIRANNVQKKRSPLAGKLFTQVLSEQLTLIDDGAAPNMPGSAPFDDEGVATKRKVVFDRGVLRTFLYDTYTASVEGKESTGNARRMGAANVFPAPTNIIVLPGTSSLDSIVRDIRRGIVVYGTIGEWLSNPVSGLLNATVTNGLLVENGEVKQAVKGVVIGGDIYKLLKDHVVALSKEVEAVGNRLVPAILIDSVSVAGE